MKLKAIICASLFCLFALSCSDGGSSSTLSSEFEGIYSITEATENTATCDVEGSSILETMKEKFFVVTLSDLQGFKNLRFVTCTDLAACKILVSDIKNNNGFPVGTASESFYKGNDQEGYTSEIITTGFASSDDYCTQPKYSLTKLAGIDSKTMLFTQKTTIGKDYPQTDKGCSTDKSLEAVKGVPCSDYLVIKGTFSEKLPR